MVRLIISGINGKMGKVLETMCENTDSVEIIGGIDINLGVPHKFPTVSDPFELQDKADAIIDFSHHSFAPVLCRYALETKTPVVFSTTGHSDDELNMIRDTSKTVPVFKSANMSLGVNLLTELVKKAAAVLNDFDVEIIEKHHNQKIDAPSGTALMIAEAVKSVRDGEYVFDRTKEKKKREKNEIGIHSVRGGTIVGEHEVIFAGNNEIISISHTAQSREIFAAGAIRAAKFIAGRQNGMYSMEDLIKEI
jgi:4-hydroxy-tetrahydrodipicolinate reductase